MLRSIVQGFLRSRSPTASLRAACSAAAAVSDGAHTNSTCSSDLGCSLNGVCRSGACACDAPWGGPACALLQILPSPVAGAGAGAGIYGVAPNVTSWGGNVVQWPQDDGRFHLFVAEIAESCGMANWKNNSFVTHAVSDAVGGPYVKADVAVPSWAHNPQVIAHGTSLFLFHIGAGDGTAALTNCSAPRPAAGAQLQTRAPHDEQFSQIHVAPGPDGPWAVLPGGGVECDNPGPLVLRNGTVLLMCSRSPGSKHKDVHARLYSAPSPRGPWHHVSEIHTVTNWSHTAEDPFLWEDARGYLHSLWHTGPLNATGEPSGVVSVHGFSRDGIKWGWSDNQPYTAIVHFEDGSTTHHATVERPKLVLDHTGTPTHLINAATSSLWPCAGCITSWKPHRLVCNACKTTKGIDSSYTIMRALLPAGGVAS